MAALKILLAALALSLATSASGQKHCCGSETNGSAPPLTALQRGDQVQEKYLRHAERLQGYYELLAGALRAHAPAQLALLEPPAPLAHGYQILPKISAHGEPAEPRPRVRSSWYSWPSTEKLIDHALDEIAGFEMTLKHGASLDERAKKRVYEALARSYQKLRERQHNIDAHIQYNRLWQAAIAADRAGYGRGTLLHDAVLERQAILDLLAAPYGVLVKKVLATLRGIDTPPGLSELTNSLIERAKFLAAMIDGATDNVSVPPFVRIERRSGAWIFHVPLYTDIVDRDFVRSVKEEVEKIWRLRHGDDEFRVALSLSYVPLEQLYRERPPPTGGKIDWQQHLALFPNNGAVLTTGAVTTHVYGRAVMLGPHAISPRVLAHEFGHILGFKDHYFRGYKDLGADGFQIMEVVAGHDDIMGAPASGAVRLSQFMLLLKELLKK